MPSAHRQGREAGRLSAEAPRRRESGAQPGSWARWDLSSARVTIRLCRGLGEQRVLGERVCRETGRPPSALDEGEEIGEHEREVTLMPGSERRGRADLPAGPSLGHGKAGKLILPLRARAHESGPDLCCLAMWNNQEPATVVGGRALVH